MQDRYVGDVGDFGKYGLLRALAGCFDELPSFVLGVIWYKVADESHNNDGGKIQYLREDKSPSFETCDPELYRKLHTLVSNNRRTLDAIERANILPFGTMFFDEELTFRGLNGGSAQRARIDSRNGWTARALCATAKCDVVFADPDNGLECKSVGPYHRLGPKYAFQDELLPIIDRGQTLVVYHHTCRQGPADLQIRERLQKLRSGRPQTCGLLGLRFRRGNSRAFLIAPALGHFTLIRRRVEQLLASPWQQHFDLVELDV
jgi:hypothetical protein